MDQLGEMNPWIQRATSLYREAQGKSYNPEYQNELKDPIPATAGMDGIFFGLLDFDSLANKTKDPSCNDEMRKHGFDPLQGLEQVRFRRPVMYKAIKDCAIACKSTGEPTISFWTEHCPEPRTSLLKMAPMDNGIGWVMIDVGRMASSISELYAEEVYTAMSLHGLG